MSDEQTFEIRLKRTQRYEFDVDFEQPGVPGFVVDETPPLGEGHGPSPARVLATAIGHCLSASALFCLGKAHVDVRAFHTTVSARLVRNERGRLRIGGLAVRLHPVVAPGDRDRMHRCLELFEDFCIVTESVRRGIEVQVQVDVGGTAPATTGASSGPAQ